MGCNYPLKVGINSTNVVGDYLTNPIQRFEMVNMTRSQPATKAKLKLQAPCGANPVRG